MPIIRCTKKLQREMGIKPPELAADEPGGSPLGSWHANLVFIERRKCVLFVNDRTLFNFIAPDVRRAEIRDLAQLFLSGLACALHSERLPKPVVDQILAESAQVTVGGQTSRSVLGSVNDLAFHYKVHVVEAGGVHSAEVPNIIRRLNRMPMGALKYGFPIEELQSLYGIPRSRDR